MVLGYFSVVGYQLYILDDHIALPKGLRPTEAMAVLTPFSMAATAVSTPVGGLLSDRWNRRKVFVGVSAGLAGLVMVVPVLSPTWPGMLVFSVLNGLAFGCFMAVDTAVVTLVLPRAEDAARDMGVLNIANAGPQIVAPFVASAVVTALGGYPAVPVRRCPVPARRAGHLAHPRRALSPARLLPRHDVTVGAPPGGGRRTDRAAGVSACRQRLLPRWFP
ncbi:MFS transporter [Streptomyces sp. NPDC007971]|uniref:MFS transporter n=1 Tax=Streptomyces sp. NPDC007971 TaxID=3364799 RepID=UPI0036EE6D01